MHAFIYSITVEEVHSGGECIRQSRPAGEQPTLQSSQHCPWAHTASPNRVQVVALQHGFIHSWDKERKIKYWTTRGPHSLWIISVSWPLPDQDFQVREVSRGFRPCLPQPLKCGDLWTCRQRSVFKKKKKTWKRKWDLWGRDEMC